MSSLLHDVGRILPGYVTQFAPLVWLHSEDPFRPADLLQHIRHTTPTVNDKILPDIPELDLDNLEVLNGPSKDPVYLTSQDDVTKLPEWLYGQDLDEKGKSINATTCVVIIVEQSPRDIDAFFFYFYSYDRGPNITQVLEPLKSMIDATEDGMHFGDHVGDWEHNMVRFRDKKPTGIYYSQHRDGSAYKWNDKALSKKEKRPIVFSAYGSHANYVSAGNHTHDTILVDYCDAGRIWDPILSANFYHLDRNTFQLTRLSPPDSTSPVTTNLTSFFYYTGFWGDNQYPDDNPLQKTVPKFGLKRFIAGPQGPIVKQLVRKGLFPDKRRTKTWTEWGVMVFMSWYPCCIRGGKKWLSAVVFIVFVVGMVVGTRFGLRRYRRRGYKRVDMDIPLEDRGPFRDEAELPRTETDER